MSTAYSPDLDHPFNPRAPLTHRSDTDLTSIPHATSRPGEQNCVFLYCEATRTLPTDFPPKSLCIMSVQLVTGAGSLVALGLGVGDIATLVAVGKRLGNWWAASEGDKEFLSLLEGDELSIIQRRGLLDVLAFNKRWKQIQLLANGQPLRLEEHEIEQVVQDSRTLLQVGVVPYKDLWAVILIIIFRTCRYSLVS